MGRSPNSRKRLEEKFIRGPIFCRQPTSTINQFPFFLSILFKIWWGGEKVSFNMTFWKEFRKLVCFWDKHSSACRDSVSTWDLLTSSRHLKTTPLVLSIFTSFSLGSKSHGNRLCIVSLWFYRWAKNMAEKWTLSHKKKITGAKLS